MDLRQLRQSELNQQKSDRRKHIVAHALQVFFDTGLEQTTMNEVADASQVGVATVFRYFETKKKLAIEAAQLLWENEYHLINHYLPKDFDDLSGLMQLEQILRVFKYYYQQRPEVFRFLEQFDNFVANEKVEVLELEKYEYRVLTWKEPILNAIKKGQLDQTIRLDFDKEVFYLSITHLLMSLASKLVIRGQILSSDLEVTGEAQLDFVLSMIIDHVRLK
jgi:AcrR family transcriptional regulator